ncbi:MAG: alpha/beta fold hydrolase [Chloroflexi bacterium]|nr:alpha/beta fold hydrolase [Chloroflexota bacterium]
MKRAYMDIPEGQVHYRSEGSGEPLLMMHQGMYSSDEFEKMAPLLSGRYRVIARDMLGYGMSDVNPPDYRIEDYARADISFMKALGIERASIVGVHSGVRVALEIAATHPEMVGRLVIYGAVGYAPGLREKLKKSYTFSPVELQEDGSHLTARLWRTAQKYGAKASVADLNRVVIAAAMAGGGAFHAMRLRVR